MADNPEGHFQCGPYGREKTEGLDITGTWDYTGSSVAFESDNLFRKAGGAVAANKIESSLDSQLNKIGFTPGITSFTFSDDATFSKYLNGRTISGTYEYDPSEGERTPKTIAGYRAYGYRRESQSH